MAPLQVNQVWVNARGGLVPRAAMQQERSYRMPEHDKARMFYDHAGWAFGQPGGRRWFRTTDPLLVR